jgi:hypothetical protein
LIHEDKKYQYEAFLPKLKELVFSGTDEAVDNHNNLRDNVTDKQLKTFLDYVHSESSAKGGRRRRTHRKNRHTHKKRTHKRRHTKVRK